MIKDERRASLVLLIVGTLCLAAVGRASAADLEQVRARIYSSTAVEFFWNQVPGSGLVEVRRDGELIRTMDARSLFLKDLDPARESVWELRLVGSDGTRSAPSRLTFATGEHDGSILEISAGATNGASDGAARFADAKADDAARRLDAEADLAAAQAVPADDDARAAAPEGPGDVVARRQVGIEPGDCIVDSIATLVNCARGATGYLRMNVRQDLACSGAGCCPGGSALVRLRGVVGLDIVGNGHRLLRRDAQRSCSLLDVSGANDLRIVDWSLDDDGSVSPCVVGDNCPRMVHVRNSRDVAFERLEVANSKGYAIYIDGVDGFAFRDSTLRDSGVLGLYVGHESRSSSRVRIERSTFRDNQTNGLALLGVSGSGTSDNRITGNLFERNHWRGQWPVEPQYGTGTTGGGQLYIAQASGVTISGNLFRDGQCENCFYQGALGTGVSGVELGIPRQRSLSDILVQDNDVRNHDAWGVFSNVGSPMDARVVVRGNRFSGNGRALAVPGAQVSGNSVGGR